jgi:hypothetical protein
MTVLHWPKLFEGRVSQEGAPDYDGYGYGNSAGMDNIFGYANGNGRGRGYGYSDGDGDGRGYGYGYGNGNGGDE